jgi:hypothetical protein
MIFWAICVVLGVLLGSLIGIEDYSYAGRNHGAGAVAGFFWGLCGGFMLSMVIGSFASGSYVQKYDTKLETIQDGSNIRGAFFLGSGVINEVSVFTWYESTGDNAYRQAQADASESTVHYTQGEPPHYVLTVKRTNKGSFWGKWFLNPESGDEHWRTYDFYVPQGTIKHDYTLDAK